MQLTTNILNAHFDWGVYYIKKKLTRIGGQTTLTGGRVGSVISPRLWPIFPTVPSATVKVCETHCYTSYKCRDHSMLHQVVAPHYIILLFL